MTWFLHQIELDLSLNLLSEETAPDFTLFQFLRKLSLATNRFKKAPKLPETIEVLSLAGNQLQEVPEAIGKCLHLVRVDFSENSIGSLDPLRQVKSLSVLLARSNKIKSARFLIFLESLVEADLSKNIIESLDDIQSIVAGSSNSKLKILNVSGNPCME